MASGFLPVTTSGLSIVQLTNVPLGIGMLSPASVAVKDGNTLTLATPSTTIGAQQLVLTSPDGESVTLGAAFLAR